MNYTGGNGHKLRYASKNGFRVVLNLHAFVILSVFFSQAKAVEVVGYVEPQLRSFFSEPIASDQQKDYFSLATNLKLTSGNAHANIFYRYDDKDEERKHFDIREAYWSFQKENFDGQLGIGRFFWGVTESHNVVNIINQDDVLEDILNKEKLGQAHIKLTYNAERSVLDFFVLPYFRKQNLYDEGGRLRLIKGLSNIETQYESNDEDKHIDFAARWSYSGDNFEMALSWFDGTDRNADIVADSSSVIFVSPYYKQISQIGFEYLWFIGDWSLKSEIARAVSSQEATMKTGQKHRVSSAAIVGFEKSSYDVMASGWDIMWFWEYSIDDRNNKSKIFYDNDSFFGARVSFNDVGSSELSGGVVVDHDTREQFWRFKFQRRVGDAFKLRIETFVFSHVNEQDSVLYPFKRDDFLQLEMQWLFGNI